jgi:non-ribosomal peptide synthetase component E (peptide arylation enzyme)
MKNWFDHILDHARMQPQRPAIVLVDRAITYGMLAAGIESCARRLARMDLGSDAPVAIAVKSPLRQVVLSFALMRIGVPSMSLGNMSQLATDMSLAAVLADSDASPGAGPARRSIAVTDEWFAPETGSTARHCHAAIPAADTCAATA